MDPERHEPPPAPPPPQPEGSTANVPMTQTRRNHSFSWSSSTSSSTSSFNSLADSFKKNNDEPPSPQLTGEEDDELNMPLGASSSRRRDYPGYDPSRIPSSIFSNPSNQMDWSIASNESLFSIHTGNSSFSLAEFMLPNNIYPLEQPTVTITEDHEVEYGRKSSSNCEEDFQETNKEPAVVIAITEPPEIVVTKKEDTPSERILLESCSNISDVPRSFSGSSARMSEESGNSCNSFAFPLLTSEIAATNELSQAPTSITGTTTDHERPQPLPSPDRESNEKENSGRETTAEWGNSGGCEAPPENNSSWFSFFSCCSLNCHCCGRARCSNANTDEKLDS